MYSYHGWGIFHCCFQNKREAWLRFIYPICVRLFCLVVEKGHVIWFDYVDFDIQIIPCNPKPGCLQKRMKSIMAIIASLPHGDTATSTLMLLCLLIWSMVHPLWFPSRFLLVWHSNVTSYNRNVAVWFIELRKWLRMEICPSVLNNIVCFCKHRNLLRLCHGLVIITMILCKMW